MEMSVIENEKLLHLLRISTRVSSCQSNTDTERGLQTGHFCSFLKCFSYYYQQYIYKTNKNKVDWSYVHMKAGGFKLFHIVNVVKYKAAGNYKYSDG